jgi:hypothetical protein
MQVAGVSMTGLGLRLNAVDLGRFGILRFGGRLGFLAGDMGVFQDRSENRATCIPALRLLLFKAPDSL